MTRLLIIPEAGRILTRVSGRPMLDHLERLYRKTAGQAVLIAPPSVSCAVRARLTAFGLNAHLIEEPRGAGVVNAILLAAPKVLAARADRIWITWPDRVSTSPATIARLRELEERDPDADVIMPVAAAGAIEIGDNGRLRRIEEGADAGLFSLSRRAYLEDLRWFAPEAGGFLRFLIGRRVVTFPATVVDDVSPKISVAANVPDLREQVMSAGGDLILVQEPGIEFAQADQALMLQALRDADADIVLGGERLALCPRSLLLNMDLESAGTSLSRAIGRTAKEAGMKVVRVPVSSALPQGQEQERGLRALLTRLGLGRRAPAGRVAERVEQAARKVADNPKRDEQH